MIKKNAFTMIELAIVVIIMAILLAGSFEGSRFFLLQNHIKATITKLNAIQNALDMYAIQNGKLPCPASITTSSGRAYTACSNTSTGIIVYNGQVRGAIPYETLNLPADMSFDAWKNKFTYTVNVSATVDIKKMIESYTGISLYNNSTSSYVTNKLVYSLVSHGPNKKGAYYYETNTKTPTTGLSTAELYNTYGTTTYNSYAIYFSNKKLGDDLVRYKTRMQLLMDTNIEDVSCYITSTIVSNLISQNSISPAPSFSIPSSYLNYNAELESTTTPKYKIKCFKYGRLGIYKDAT